MEKDKLIQAIKELEEKITFNSKPTGEEVIELIIE